MSSDRDRRESEQRARLRQALHDNKLVIVVGAGVSLSATHPSPSRITWTGLIRNGLDYLEEERFVAAGNEDLNFYRNSLKKGSLDQRQLLRACNYLKEELVHHNQYATWLDTVFSSIHKEVKQPAILRLLGQAHRQGAKLLTTNYDELLEHFCNLQRVRRSIPDDVRKYERGTLNGVFHIHGSYQDPEDVVLDAIGYYKVQQSDDVQDLMKAYLAHNTLLFIGCGSGLEDPNFDALLRWASERAKNIANHHYLLARTAEDIKYDPLITLRYGPDYSDLLPYLASVLGLSDDDMTHPVNLDVPSSQNVSLMSYPTQSPRTSLPQIQNHLTSPPMRMEVAVQDPSEQRLQGFHDAIRGLGVVDMESEIRLPMDGTCEWIFEVPMYEQWLHATETRTLLCITGRLGSGKSTLIKHVVTSLRDQANHGIASFFCRPVRDDSPGHSPAEIYLSLLLQVMRWPSFRQGILEPLATRLHEILQNTNLQEHKQELRDALLRLLRKLGAERVILFLDAIDDCSNMHEMSLLLQDLELARISGLRICYTSRQVIPMLQAQSLCLAIEDFNQGDIAAYIRNRLPVGGVISQAHRNLLSSNIERRSSGVFLWVVLAVDLLQRYISKGRDISYLHGALSELPKELTNLYQDIIARAVKLNSAGEIQTMIHVLQWVLFSARPLTAGEWHHVLAFIENPSLRSISEWKKSPTYTESDDLLLQRLRSVCCGLVEVKERQIPLDHALLSSEAGSLGPAAGSFESRQYVRVIHRSVHEYLLKGNAFTLLDRSISHPVGCGHAYLLDICVRYSFLKEMMDAFKHEDSSRRQTMDARSGSRDPSAYSDSDDDISLGGSAFGSSFDASYDEDSLLTPDWGDALRRRRYARSVGSDAGSDSSAATTASTRSTASTIHHLTFGSTVRRRTVLDFIRGIGSPASVKLPWPSAFVEDVEVIQSPENEPSEYLRTLESPPELWQYSRDMLVHHASAAEKAGILPEATLLFLETEDVAAWASTRRDMQHGATLWYFAARWNLVLWIEFFQKRPPSKAPRGGQWVWPPIVAIRHGHLESFKAIVSSAVAVKRLCWPFTDLNGRAALHHAAMAPSKDFLAHVRDVCEQAGLKKIAVVDGRDDMGWTALHLAAAHGCTEQVKALLAVGASVRCCDRLQNTPLHLACVRKDADINMCQVMVDAGCDREALNFKRETAASCARAHGNLDIALYLVTLTKNPRIAARDSECWIWTVLQTIYWRMLPERLKHGKPYRYDILLAYRVYEREHLMPKHSRRASTTCGGTWKMIIGWMSGLLSCFR